MRVRAAILAALAACPATAQDLTPPEAAVLPRIVDTLCLDLVEARNGCETAMLLTSEADPFDVDLLILSDRRSGPVETLAVARDLVWDGPAFGQAPRLEARATASGRPLSLRVISENIGVGRTAWTRTLTIAWRDGRFVVAGYTYATRDRLNTAHGRCDVNLLTGQWETRVGIGALDGYDETKSGRARPDMRPVADWRMSKDATRRPAVCADAFARVDELSQVEVPR